VDDLPTRRALSRHLSGLGLASTAIVALAVCLGRGVKVPTVQLGVLLLLLHMALQHTRHQLLLAVVGTLILAEPFAVALGPPPSAPSPCSTNTARAAI